MVEGKNSSWIGRVKERVQICTRMGASILVDIIGIITAEKIAAPQVAVLRA
jgi:hypothetical protein